MRASPILSLFEERPPARSGPSGFVVSFGVHVLVCGALYTAVHHKYMLVPARISPRYVVRMLELPELHPSHPKTVAAERQPTLKRDPSTSASPAADDAPASNPNESAQEASAAPEALAEARIPKDATAQLRAAQTMIVPETAKQMPITRPLPQVVMWNSPATEVKVLVSAPQQPSITEVLASINPPNQEMHVADLKLSATPLPAMKPLPPASTTTPVAKQTAEQERQTLIAMSQRAGQPETADLIVVSDLQLQSGPVAAPVFNAVAPANANGSVHPGDKSGRAAEGLGVARVSHSGPGAASSRGVGAGPAKDGTELGGNNAGAANGAAKGVRTGAAGAGSGNGPGFTVHGGDLASANSNDDALIASTPQRLITRVMLPRDGKFGVVVVGSSTADEYPETAALWRNRLAYSVYLPVGIAQKWIMQYAIPSSEVAAASGAGRLEAPWPYDISRPSIDDDAQADAIIVHGILSAAGKLERLAVVLPEQLSEAAFLVRALELWQFRPALRDGQPCAVDVLLIIPASAGE